MESILFCLDGRFGLANSIIERCNSWNVEHKVRLGHTNEQIFSDSEVCIDFIDSVRGKRVYLLTSPTTSNDIIRLTLAIDAAVRGAAKEIVPILPYFPYSRSDKKDQKRGPIGAKVMAKMIENSGATSLITFDLHADQIQGFFDIPVTHIEGKNVFVDYVASVYTPETKLCGPDAGSSKRIKRMRDQLQKKHNIDATYVMMDKTRIEANKVDKMIIIGDVKDCDVIVLDDIGDTLGTLSKAIDTLYENGAKSVRAIISHPILSGKAYQILFNSKITELVVSDSLAIARVINVESEGYQFHMFSVKDKVKVIGISRHVGMAMAAINNDMSYEMLKSREKL